MCITGSLARTNTNRKVLRIMLKVDPLQISVMGNKCQLANRASEIETVPFSSFGRQRQQASIMSSGTIVLVVLLAIVKSNSAFLQPNGLTSHQRSGLAFVHPV